MRKRQKHILYCELPFNSREEFERFMESEGIDIEKISTMSCEDLQRAANDYLNRQTHK